VASIAVRDRWAGPGGDPYAQSRCRAVQRSLGRRRASRTRHRVPRTRRGVLMLQNFVPAAELRAGRRVDVPGQDRDNQIGRSLPLPDQFSGVVLGVIRSRTKRRALRQVRRQEAFRQSDEKSRTVMRLGRDNRACRKKQRNVHCATLPAKPVPECVPERGLATCLGFPSSSFERRSGSMPTIQSDNRANRGR